MPLDVPSTSHSTSQGLASTSHESNKAAPDSDSDDVLDDGRGGSSAQSDMARTKKKVVYEDRFLSLKAYIDFQMWWKERS